MFLYTWFNVMFIFSIISVMLGHLPNVYLIKYESVIRLMVYFGNDRVYCEPSQYGSYSAEDSLESVN